MSDSARHSLPFLAAGQSQKETTHNEALALLDVGLHAAAVTAGLNAPPPTPAPGACWIVGDAPTGAWAGQAGALACWTPSGWRFLAARTGMTVWLEDDRLWALRDDGEWLIGQARAAALVIDGEQVVGPREPAITAPTGGTVIDAEARAAIAAIIDRLSTHGLIAG